MKSPFFIIGNPRSGTSLFRLMLNNHRELVIPPECGFAVWFMDEFDDWREGDSGESSIDEFTKVISSARKIETWNLDFEELREFLYERAPESYAEAVSQVYVFYANQTIGKSISRWGDKNNFHIDYIRKIDKLFKECKFIHIIRDGRDVACSYKKLSEKNIESEYAPNLPKKVKSIAKEWYKNIKNREEVQEPKEFLQWKRKTLEPPSDDRVGVYREALTQDEKSTFNQIAAPILEKYGYI